MQAVEDRRERVLEEVRAQGVDALETKPLLPRTPPCTRARLPQTGCEGWSSVASHHPARIQYSYDRKPIRGNGHS
jgi:hypothetical protein